MRKVLLGREVPVARFFGTLELPEKNFGTLQQGPHILVGAYELNFQKNLVLSHSKVRKKSSDLFLQTTELIQKGARYTEFL